MTEITTPPTGDHIESITLEDEMQKSFLDYAMSVIVSRALPDVRDGLKPVHRRILYAMKEGGYDSTKPFRKSARIVGDVMGKYHPHGDMAIYDAMVRMAQDFSMRVQLVHGQGNYGSMDGDSPAAMRYTEARLQKVAEYILMDYDKATVDFIPNYDDSDTEPAVLPARFPNILVNGGGGIAVGMATNIPPHNLGEVIDACCAYVDDPAITIDGLMEYIQGPDFPTACTILGRRGIKSAYHTGKGSVVMRSNTKFEPLGKDRTSIIVTSIPYQVNKAKLVARISECAKEKLIEGISEVRDESDRNGIRVAIELQRNIEPEVVLNQLYTHTAMQTSFGVNTVALHNGMPKILNLQQIIQAFVEFREVVIRRRTIFELNKARDRAHILVGLAVAVANIDEVIALIRNAPDPQTAREGLMSRAWPADDVAPLIKLVDETSLQENNTYKMTETQARAILELRLHRLTGLERDKIAADLKEVTDNILYYLELLGSRQKLMTVLKEELLEVKEKFNTPRLSEISEDEFEKNLEDLIHKEDMAVTISHNGYIKRVPLDTYRAQKRGGKGKSGMTTRDDDFVSHLIVANTHTPILIFTSFGQVYQYKVYQLPLGSAQARGKPIINLLPNMQPGERIATVMPLPNEEDINDDHSILFATSKGNVRRNSLKDFLNIKANGKIAMKLKESGEMLVDVRTCTDNDDIFLATKYGRCIRFPVTCLRVFNSRNSTGVKGIKLIKDDVVISLSILTHTNATPEERDAYKAGTLSAERKTEMAAKEEVLLTVTENGLGKRTSSYEYRVAGRGGQGVAAMACTKRTGDLVAAFPVGAHDQIMLVTQSGQMIRTAVNKIRVAGRTTQGVMLLNVAEGENVISVAHVAETEEVEGI